MPINSKLGIAAVLMLLGIGGAFLGVRWWTTWRHIQTTDNAYLQADTSPIAPKVEGYIREVRVGENQSVSKGDVLFVIDDKDFLARLEKAEADLASQKAAVNSFQSRIVQERAVIAEANANLESARAEQVRSDKDRTRYQSLIGNGTVSAQRFDQAQADAEKARAATARASAARDAEMKQLLVIESQKLQAEADLGKMEAQLKLARIDLENTIIRAPVDGTVGNKQGQVGQYVRPGMLIAAVVPLQSIRVVANFKETQMTRIAPGQEVKIRVDTFPGVVIPGRVDSLAPGTGSQFSLLPPENATGNFTKIVQRIPVRITILPDAPMFARLRPGMSAEVEIDTRTGAPVAGK